MGGRVLDIHFASANYGRGDVAMGPEPGWQFTDQVDATFPLVAQLCGVALEAQLLIFIFYTVYFVQNFTLDSVWQLYPLIKSFAL